MLIEAFPKATEGELAQRLTALVRNETCAEVALALDLGAAIRLGGGEAQSGGRRQGGDPRRRLRGGDRRALSRRRHRRRAPLRRRATGATRMLNWQGSLRDAKTTLQEWAQGRGLAHAGLRDRRPQRSRPRPALRGRGQRSRRSTPGRGEGRTRRDAEQEAAAARSRPRKACGRPMAMPPETTRHPLRLRRPHRRAQCRQVDAGQPAGRHQGLDRQPQGADDPLDRPRHRHGRPLADRLRRHARHLRAEAPARPGDGRDRLGRRARRRPGRAPDRRAERASTTEVRDLLARLGGHRAAEDPHPQQDRPGQARDAARARRRSEPARSPSSAPSWSRR